MGNFTFLVYHYPIRLVNPLVIFSLLLVALLGIASAKHIGAAWSLAGADLAASLEGVMNVAGLHELLSQLAEGAVEDCAHIRF